MEGGLAKLDFLSDANSRMKKFNQLMKRVMEKLYNFVIPGKLKIADTLRIGRFSQIIYIISRKMINHNKIKQTL